MTEHKNVQEAIAAIWGEVGYVRKEKSPNLSYTFASESGFIQALRPSFITHGLILRVASLEVVRLENYTNKNGTVMTSAVVSGTIEFVHAPTSTGMIVQALGEGMDAGDKAVNKAMTDMYKYALRQTFMIETGDDPDETAPVERSVAHEAAAELGATVKAVEISLEEASAIVTEDGTPYGKLPMEELVNRFNGLQKMKKNTPEKFTEEHRAKMAAAKLLISEFGKKAQKEVYGD